MKRLVRQGVFETNSSSTHAVAILSQAEYDKYKAGEFYISRYGNLYDEDQYEEYIEDQKKRARESYESSQWAQKEYSTFERYWENDAIDDVSYEFDLDRMEIEHTERELDGITVHAISVYGYDN